MGKTRNYKICPDCKEQVSPSCKLCICGCSIVTKKSSTSTDAVQIRRTERIRRVKPNYYDALDYERPPKKKVRTKITPPLPSKTHKAPSNSLPNPIPHRMQLTADNKKKKPEIIQPKEEDLEEIILSEETLAKFTLILEEINRKIYASSWRA